MKFHQRLDFQVALIFILAFSTVITITGVLQQVSVRIWQYRENPELNRQLSSSAKVFVGLHASLSEAEAIEHFSVVLDRNSSLLMQSEFLYILTDSALDVMVDSSEDYTQVELIRPEPSGDKFSVIASNVYRYEESFLTFTEVPALPIKTELDELYYLFVVPNPVEVLVPNTAQVALKNFRHHLNVFGWYYLLIAVGIVVFLRLRMQPLRALEQAAQALTNGETPDVPRVQTQRDDEVGRLVLAFDSAIKRLNENELARKRLIADISHELRTPLTNISGRIEAFDDGLIDDHEALIRFTSQQVSGLIAIVEDMDVLTAIDSGQFALNRCEVEIRSLLESHLSTYNIDGKFKWAIDGAPTRAQVDTARFQQIINNLLDNAVKARPDGLVINIEVSKESSYVVVCFEDNGPGVPESELPYLFDRLYRVDESRNSQTGGSGLGLAIVKDIIISLGGDVSCYINRQGGLGTRITLPIPVDGL